jgi:hypothetical protein
MLRYTSVLVSLVLLIDRLPWPPEPPKRPRGHPKTYSDRLIVKALVIMIIRRLYTAYAFLAFLGIHLKRDSWVSVMYAEALNSTKSSVTFQSTDRHGILGQKPPDFQVSL